MALTYTEVCIMSLLSLSRYCVKSNLGPWKELFGTTGEREA